MLVVEAPPTQLPIFTIKLRHEKLDLENGNTSWSSASSDSEDGCSSISSHPDSGNVSSDSTGEPDLEFDFANKKRRTPSEVSGSSNGSSSRIAACVSAKKANSMSWHSLFMEADYVLEQWERSARRPRRPVNKVLRSATTFLCPKSAVADRILLGRYQRQPLRRYTSELDLRTASRGLGAPRPQDNETSCSRQSIAFLDELVLNKVGYRHEVAEAGSTEVTSTSSSHSGDADECDANQTASANAPRNLIELNLIRKSLSIYSLFEETGSRGPIMSPRRHANFLVQRLKLNNPIFFAMQITSVDQGLLLQLHPAEVMQLVLGKQHSLQQLDLRTVRTLLEFSQQLARLVKAAVSRESTCDMQAAKLAAFIEVACALRRLRNWQSLQVVIKALQTPQIYRQEGAWKLLADKFPVHLNDYKTLCDLVNRSEFDILRSSLPCIPSLTTLVRLFQVHCAAKWDLTINKPRWTEPPNLTGWLEKQLVGAPPELNAKQEIRLQVPFVGETHGSPRNSFLPDNDPIRFIPYSSLPRTWTEREVRRISICCKRQVTDAFISSFKSEMCLLRQYAVFKGDIPVHLM